MANWSYYIDPQYNDFRVTNGSLEIVRGSNAVSQQVLVALNTEYGEWYLDTDEGVIYYSSSKTLNDNTQPGILGGKLSATEVSFAIRQAIVNTPGVIEITDFTIEETDRNARGFTIQATCTVETGDVNGVGTPTSESIMVVF